MCLSLGYPDAAAERALLMGEDRRAHAQARCRRRCSPAELADAQRRAARDPRVRRADRLRAGAGAGIAPERPVRRGPVARARPSRCCRRRAPGRRWRAATTCCRKTCRRCWCRSARTACGRCKSAARHGAGQPRPGAAAAEIGARSRRRHACRTARMACATRPIALAVQAATAPKPGEVVLSQRRVFILPTRAGLGFCAAAARAADRLDQLQPGPGLRADLLRWPACALVDMHLTFRNLAYLHLRAGTRARRCSPAKRRSSNCTCRTAAASTATRSGSSSPATACRARRTAVRHAGAQAPAGDAAGAEPCARLAGRAAHHACTPASRSACSGPGATGSRTLRALVYPYPGTNGAAAAGGGSDAAATAAAAPARTTSPACAAYQAGDAMRQLAWRQIARLDPAIGGQLVTKHFEGGAASELRARLRRPARVHRPRDCACRA